MKNFLKHFNHFKSDLPASIVVFFVALPLCLGIALASGAPLFSGIIAGIVGGVIVGFFSGSHLGVSGPAAGLAVIVLDYITQLGSFEAFLVAVVLAGAIQVAMGFMRLGTIAYYFPSSVIKGMLTGIGLIIIIKQIPHALGYDADFIGDEQFLQADGENSFSQLRHMLSFVTPGAILISVVSLSIMIFWEQVLMKRSRIIGMIPGPLVVVVAGIIMGSFVTLSESQIVQIPVAQDFAGFLQQFKTPDFNQLKNLDIYAMAFVIALVASIETLLCVEATDKLDPHKQVTPTNRELKAQGIGNIVSGLIGGLPVTQVIVRSSANISFGGRTKLSTICHGLLLLICAISIPKLLNMIPLASLACVLLVVGYKLAKPSLFKRMFEHGFDQFLPFLITIISMLFLDLLKGVALGMVMAIFYILYNNFRNAYQRVEDTEGKKEGEHVIRLAEEISFLNKGSILQLLDQIPANSKVTIDGTRSKFIDYDVVEIIQDFQVNARSKNIDLKVKGVSMSKT